MTQTHQLILLPQKKQPDGAILLAADWYMAGKITHQFFFKVRAEHYDAQMEQHANHHLLAMLMPAMRYGGKLRIEGIVDPHLLGNLDQFMNYWTRWSPERLKMINIEAAECHDAPHAMTPSIISNFSGDVDSLYSFLKAESDLGLQLSSLLFQECFDIDPRRQVIFQMILDQYRKWLQARGQNVVLIPLETNARETARKFQLNWLSMARGIYLAAGMHLFSHHHTMGCIPSSDTPTTLKYPCGSTPVTDPLLSTSALGINYHGLLYSKFAKIQEIVKDEDCCHILRVCHENDVEVANCGRCRNCLSSLVMMHAAREDSWRSSFPNVTSFEQAMKLLQAIKLDSRMLEHFDDVRDFAIRHRDASTARQFDELVQKNHRKNQSQKIFLRRLFYDAKVRMFCRYNSLFSKT